MTSQIEMPWVALALAVPLFLVAFLFFGSLMLGTGSLGSNMREAQQLAMVWSLTAALPMMMMAVLLREPHGIVARVMTWLPFSAGPLIMFRASTDLDALAWWEVVGAFVVLLVSTWIALRIGARLFRIGLLSSSRPKLARNTAPGTGSARRQSSHGGQQEPATARAVRRARACPCENNKTLTIDRTQPLGSIAVVTAASQPPATIVARQSGIA